MPPPLSSIAQIETAVTEQSDYLVTATVVGPDGTTGVEPAAVSTLTATLISLEPGGGVIFADRNVLSSLSAGGAFSMEIPYGDLAVAGSPRFQQRLLILKLIQTNGKRRVQGAKFYVENMPGL